MKYYFIKIFKISMGILILCLFAMILGCNSTVEKTNKSGIKSTVVNEEKKATYINPEEVKWITLTSARMRYQSKVLFKENSLNKINRIIGLINNGTNKRPASRKEIQAITSKMRRVGLQIKMEDESTIFIYPSFIIKKKKIKNGEHWTGVTNNDRFVLVIDKDDKMTYYTVSSEEVPKYISNESYKDMPKVEEFIIIPRTLKLDSRINAFGDGCTAKEVELYIEKDHRTRYLLARIKPNLGKWNWTGILKREFITPEGKKVFLQEGKYFLQAQFEKKGIGYGTIDVPKK